MVGGRGTMCCYVRRNDVLLPVNPVGPYASLPSRSIRRVDLPIPPTESAWEAPVLGTQLGLIVLGNASASEDEMRVRPHEADASEKYLEEIASRLVKPSGEEGEPKS